jgi:4-oxalocrotonate tautomerase
MPILTVKVSGKKTQDLTNNIASLLMDLTHQILKKKPDLTAITIEYVDHESWFVGGKPLSKLGKNSFYFDIKITDETNTKEEKAQYIRQVFDVFAHVLGNLHEESYIYVQDVRGTSYGYGGKTQEYRFHH